jgi:AmiR/NasT family two-component response regulator
MPCSDIWIAPHLRVLVVDADKVYAAGLRRQLNKLGFRAVDEATTTRDTLERIESGAYDIVMLEIARPYQPVWDALEDFGPGTTLVVGMSLDRSGRDWVEAIHQGANAILMKAFYTHLLQPVLAHMLASPAAHRCRLVQFPRREPMEAVETRPSRRFEGDARDW